MLSSGHLLWKEVVQVLRNPFVYQSRGKKNHIFFRVVEGMYRRINCKRRNTCTGIFITQAEQEFHGLW
jgi:hypothetical protein